MSLGKFRGRLEVGWSVDSLVLGVDLFNMSFCRVKCRQNSMVDLTI